MPRVGATEKEPTHDVSLSDGTTTLYFNISDSNGIRRPLDIKCSPYPRSSIKTTSGNMKYSDGELPYTTLAQDDWSGGRGNEWFDTNTSMYYDANGANTLYQGKIIPNPRPRYATGAYSVVDKSASSVDTGTHFQGLYGANLYLAGSFTPSSSYTTSRIRLCVYGSGTHLYTAKVHIYSDDSGKPGTSLKSATIVYSIIPGYIDVSIAQALTSGTKYWVVVYGGDTASSSGFVSILCDSTSDSQYSSNGTSWAHSGVYAYSPNFRVYPALSEFSGIFFDFKGSTYMVKNPVDGTAPSIWINGEQGVASSGTTTTLVDSSKTGGSAWTTNEWAGCVVKLNSGAGSGVVNNFSTVASNTGDTLTVSPAFDVAPGSGTEYSIVKSNKWTDVTDGTTYPSATVTDVLVVNQCVYFAQGDAVDMIRMRAYNSSGWVRSWTTETNNKATHLKSATDILGVLQVWKATLPNLVAKATAVDGGGTSAVAALSFGTALTVGSSSTKITGLEEYGDPMTMWVLKEDMVYYLENTGTSDYFWPIQLKEMVSGASEANGSAHCVQGVYLFFSYQDSIERYYNAQLDDINPNRGYGLPENRRGNVNKLISMPGKIMFSILPNVQSTGYASIQIWDGVGFHEYYRAPIGERIFNMHLQTLPGTSIDRLWISVGDEIVFLDHIQSPSDTSEYTPMPFWSLTTSKFHAGTPTIKKMWKDVRLLAGFGVYLINYATSWYALSSVNFTAAGGASPMHTGETTTVVLPTTTSSETISFSLCNVGVPEGAFAWSGNYIREFFALIVDLLQSQPVKFSYSFLTRINDELVDIESLTTYTPRSESVVETTMLGWIANATQLTFRCNYSPYDNKTVWLEPPVLRPYRQSPYEQMEGHVTEITLLEA